METDSPPWLHRYYPEMGIYLTQVLGNSPYMLWSSVARVAVPPTSDL